MTYSWESVVRAIDHTLLRTDATRGEIEKLCREALAYRFASVCVQPWRVAWAASLLEGTEVKVCTVISFPQGATLTTVKRFETIEVIRMGAQEVDVVINVGALKEGDRCFVENDLRMVVEAAHAANALVKAIIEIALLTTEEKILACQLSLAAGADFVKTSTGMTGSGATVEDVELIRSIVGGRAGVKASGGIRTGAEALAMMQAGASRLGTSASVAIVHDLGAPVL